MLDGEDIRVCPDGVCPGHAANGVEGVGESMLQCHYVPDLGCGTRGSHLGPLHLEGRLGRACSFGAEAVYKGLFYGLNRSVDGTFALCTFDLQRIAITPLEGSCLPHAMQLIWDRALEHNGAASTSGSCKVTAFVAFLLLQGLMGVGTFMLSTCQARDFKCNDP